MVVWRHWDLTLDVDHVLRAQGADPECLRARRSPALAVAAQALAAGLPLLRPAVACQRLPVAAFRHQTLVLGVGSFWLSGLLVAERLRAARQVAALICTIGPALEHAASAQFTEDPAVSVAMDALGSAAVHQLATLACDRVAAQVTASAWHTSVPLSPGAAGWPARAGQRQLFALMDAAAVGVTLSPSGMMLPRKSTSLVIGIGPDIVSGGSVCDLCDLRDSCRYRPLYERAHGHRTDAQ
jgi:hypothetical protein